MTVLELEQAIEQSNCQLVVESFDLLIPVGLPEPLAAAAEILQTGLRARLTGKQWHGCNAETGRIQMLKFQLRIPTGITLLMAHGDPSWDRIPPHWIRNHPELFAGEYAKAQHSRR